MDGAGDYKDLKLKLDGLVPPGRGFFRNMLFDQLYASIPKDPNIKVQIYNAEIVPGGYTNWHCHNGATFFIAIQGIFEAEFEEGVLVNAKAGDVYSEPEGRFHRGHRRLVRNRLLLSDRFDLRGCYRLHRWRRGCLSDHRACTRLFR